MQSEKSGERQPAINVVKAAKRVPRHFAITAREAFRRLTVRIQLLSSDGLVSTARPYNIYILPVVRATPSAGYSAAYSLSRVKFSARQPFWQPFVANSDAACNSIARVTCLAWRIKEIMVISRLGFINFVCVFLVSCPSICAIWSFSVRDSCRVAFTDLPSPRVSTAPGRPPLYHAE